MNRKEHKSEGKSRIQEARKWLLEVSQPFRLGVKMGALDTVNEGIRNMYSEQGHKVLHTYREWQEKGFQVKKGAKALFLWGSPVKAKKKWKEKPEPESSEVETDYFPVCYVFSNQQVEQRKAA